MCTMNERRTYMLEVMRGEVAVIDDNSVNNTLKSVNSNIMLMQCNCNNDH